jgi:2-polyprenyl-6-methoxyphenol hydroxylase-like FAD-dependent oxidoreductase
MIKTEIAIVGAGPVGLATALEAARLGKRVRIFDAESSPTSESWKPVVQPNAWSQRASD